MLLPIEGMVAMIHNKETTVIEDGVLGRTKGRCWIDKEMLLAKRCPGAVSPRPYRVPV